MWAVIYIAPGKKEAENVQRLLAGEGLLVKLREIGPLGMDGNSTLEVLVPESEVGEAMEIINLI